MQIGLKLQFTVPDHCPPNCPHFGESFDQGNACSRCPVFCCGCAEVHLLEPQDFTDEVAASWQKFFEYWALDK